MPRPRPHGKAKRQPAPQAAEADPLADAALRPFVERYCDLAAVKLLEKGADLRELKLPPAERAHFQGRESVRLALSLDALERSPDAEIAVLGSPFLTHLIEAIRTRAGRLSLGMIPPPAASDAPDAAARRGSRVGAARGVGAAIGAWPTRLGLCLQRLGDKQGAIGELRIAVKCKPDLTVAHRNLAELLVENGGFDEAALHLQDALRL